MATNSALDATTEDDSNRRRNSVVASACGGITIFWTTLIFFAFNIDKRAVHTPVRFDNATIMVPCRHWQLRSLSAEYCSSMDHLTVFLSKNGQTKSTVLHREAIKGLFKYYKMCVVAKRHDYCKVPACRTNFKNCSIHGGRRVKFFLSNNVFLYARYDYVNGALVECYLNTPSSIMFNCSDLHVVTAALLLDPTVE